MPPTRRLRHTAVFIPILLLACTATPPQGTPSEGSPDSSEPAATGGELTIGISNLGTTLDSQVACDLVTWSALRLVNDPLVYVDDDLETIRPWLAESWEQTEPNAWTLHLREGVEFHNGEPFNAESVKFTLERFKNPQVCLGTTMAYIDHVDVIDDQTVSIVTVDDNYWSTMVLLAFADMLPPVAASFESGAAEEFGTLPSGTGPYRVAEWLPDDRLVLEANTDYWAYAPEFDGITWRIIKEDSTRASALLNGEVDMINNIPVEQFDAIQDAGFEVKTIPTVRPISIGVNMVKDTPFSADVRVRQALQYALDRQGLVDSILAGHADVMDSEVVHPDLQYAAEFDPYSYDPDRAQQLLEEAGFPDGISDCVFGGLVGSHIKDQEMGQAILGQMQAAGFNCELDQQEIGGYLAEARKGADSRYDLSMLSLSPASFGMHFALGILYTNSPYTQWDNPELEGLWQQAGVSSDDAERESLYEEAQRIAFEESVFIHLYFNPTIDAVKSGVPFEPRQDEWILLEGRFREGS